MLNVFILPMRANPFFLPFDTPHGTTPFNLIEEQDFQPALEEGMRREDAEIDAIVNNPAPPTFENTLLPLERSGELLSRVETVMGNLISACTRLVATGENTRSIVHRAVLAEKEMIAHDI